VLAEPAASLAGAAFGFACESADMLVSPVDALSTGVEDGAVIAEAVFIAESDAAAVLSLFGASFRAHATARLSTPATSTARLTAEKDLLPGSSKQRFIDMLVHSCT
jgi:hypothetical protein